MVDRLNPDTPGSRFNTANIGFCGVANRLNRSNRPNRRFNVRLRQWYQGFVG